jgi:DNA repair protein RecN (Recombination protein N)
MQAKFSDWTAHRESKAQKRLQTLPKRTDGASLISRSRNGHHQMLRFLSIRNFAIIEQVELEFAPGFNVISGETGAGKSILIDALGLLLGARAPAGKDSEADRQADLSAEFDLDPHPSARAWLEEHAMDDGNQVLLRRVLPAKGASRAWINGRGATIGQLMEIGSLLVEIHGQHEHQRLSNADRQRALIDRQIDPTTGDAVAQAYADWRLARTELNAFEKDCGDPAQLELLQFQSRELEALDLKTGEYAELERQQEKLARGDEIRLCLDRAKAALDNDEGGAVRDLLTQAEQALDQVRTLDQRFVSVGDLIREAAINVDEATAELERFDLHDESDPRALEEINRRLEKCLDLSRKHRVRPDELPQLTQQISARLDALAHQDDQREALESNLKQSLKVWQTAADALTHQRQKAATSLAKATEIRLHKLGMTQAKFEIDVSRRDRSHPNEQGQDAIEFRFSANAGQSLQALHKVASGGELSRVSLALMIASQQGAEPPSRVFDEVDAGIGGETAHVVGAFLREVSRGGQAFCVTHLAQVAARADHHYHVVKTQDADHSSISVEALDRSGRENELARMLGNRRSAGSIAHAKEMLDSG